MKKEKEEKDPWLKAIKFVDSQYPDASPDTLPKQFWPLEQNDFNRRQMFDFYSRFKGLAKLTVTAQFEQGL